MNLDFNLQGTAPSSGGSFCFPFGDYPVEIIKEESIAVKNKPQSGMCVFTLKVLAGQYAGQTQKHRLNLWSESDTAKQIAQAELSALAIVTNRTAATATEQFVGAQFIATMGPQEDNPKYSQVIAVKDQYGRTPAEIISGSAPTAAQVAAPAPPPPPPPPQQIAPVQPAWGASARGRSHSTATRPAATTCTATNVQPTRTRVRSTCRRPARANVRGSAWASIVPR